MKKLSIFFLWMVMGPLLAQTYDITVTDWSWWIIISSSIITFVSIEYLIKEANFYKRSDEYWDRWERFHKIGKRIKDEELHLKLVGVNDENG